MSQCEWIILKVHKIPKVLSNLLLRTRRRNQNVSQSQCSTPETPGISPDFLKIVHTAINCLRPNFKCANKVAWAQHQQIAVTPDSCKAVGFPVAEFFAVGALLWLLLSSNNLRRMLKNTRVNEVSPYDMLGLRWIRVSKLNILIFGFNILF